MPASPTTFPAALALATRRDAGRPLVTFYDDATGERVELSVATYANWVAKTAGLARDELDVERGGLALVDLPTHWLGAVWLGAAWSLGLAVTDDPSLADRADVVVCGPDTLATYQGRAGRMPVVAISLRPLGGRFREPLPAGVVDYGAVVLAQPDVLVTADEPDGDDIAWHADGTTQAGLLAEVAAAPCVRAGGRLLTDVAPCSRGGLATLVAPVLVGAGTVWVRHPDETAWGGRVSQERVSDELRRPLD